MVQRQYALIQAKSQTQKYSSHLTQEGAGRRPNYVIANFFIVC